jgi:hypothetical protein
LFLQLISEDMLVVEQQIEVNGDTVTEENPAHVPTNSIATRKKSLLKRLSCPEVLERLTRFVKQCDENPDFATKPAPWKNEPKSTGTNLEAVQAELNPLKAELAKRVQLRQHTGTIVPRTVCK